MAYVDPLGLYLVCYPRPGLTGSRGGAPFVDSVCGPVGGGMLKELRAAFGGNLVFWEWDENKLVMWETHDGELVPRYRDLQIVPATPPKVEAKPKAKRGRKKKSVD